MDKRALEIILTDQREDLEKKATEALCPREEEKLVELSSPLAQVVTGIRRCGKSTLCYQVLADNDCKFAYVNFNDERLADISDNDLNDVLEVLYKMYGDFSHLFLDEIQDVEGWHLFVNRMLSKGMHIVLTGSNARLLSGELATYLTGRNKKIYLYPFSFKEFCIYGNVDIKKKATKEEGLRRAAFDTYMEQGGFPELALVESKKAYVNGLVEDILKRDIEQRFKIAYKAEFEAMAHHLMNISPTIVSIQDLAEIFSLKSEHTAKKYLQYLKEAYMLMGIQQYSSKSKVRVTHEKIYTGDVALMDKRENALVGKNLGFRLETIVLIHLVRKCKMEDQDVYYLNDRSGECNFVVCSNNKVMQAIQVSYDISSQKTRTREIKGLVLAAKLTRCTDLLLLTDHERATIEDSGFTIKVQPVYEWCLELGV